MEKIIFNIILLIILFGGNIFIVNYNHYFTLIYACILIYHIYIFYFLIKKDVLVKANIKYFIITSIFLYFTTYFIICDPNPFFSFFILYTFNPCFIKAILIIIIHTYFLSKYVNYYYKNNYINLDPKKNKSFKFKFILDSYFLSDIINKIIEKFSIKFFIFGIILFFSFDALIFLNRIKIWIYFFKKNKTLPSSFSKNTTFYITSNIVNAENIIESYIKEMKKLINYLGENNVIISLVENGDSKDNTRKYLKEFQEYLNGRKIVNKFLLTKEIDDPRKNSTPFNKISRLRIEYYSKLRNKCLDLLYEKEDVDFENTIIIFFNDIVFKYEDIINLLSTNKEDFDAVCGLDMVNHLFYDCWVAIDLDGNALKNSFPFFLNKEGQDLVVYHKPIRVFSCWNGVIAFKASPLKDKKIQFRHKYNFTILTDRLFNAYYYESECTYFHIDLFSSGYTKKFINPNVRVTYKNEGFFEVKFLTSSIYHIYNYFMLYFLNFYNKRNKDMSNYIDKEIKLKANIERWYLVNKIDRY